MPKVNNDKDLVSEIELSESECIIALNKFLNKNKNKKPYHGLV